MNSTSFALTLIGGTNMKRITTLTLIVGALILSFQNCSNKNFSAQSSDTVTKNGDPTNPPPPPVTPPVDTTLKMRLSTPVCGAYSTCPATFTLVDAPTQELRFAWATNDTKYNDGAQYAKPKVNYVPTSGTLVFGVGETTKTINIQSLAFDSSLKIPFLWQNCMSGGNLVACPTVVP